MTEDKAKKQLAKMLRSFTPGSVLHLLADLYRQAAEDAQAADDARGYQQAKQVESALFVVGLGVDAANPK